MIKIRVIGTFIGVWLTFSCAVAAEQQTEQVKLPLWELGLGFGGFSIPQYMGSDERYTFPFAFPFLIYRGKNWWLDRSGLRNRLYSHNNISLDLSLSGGLPSKNNNKARQGMAKLHLTGEFGPRLNWIIYQDGMHDLRMMLPWRAALNIKGRFVGSLLEPGVQYIYQKNMNQSYVRLKLAAGLLYTSQRFNDVYYSVSAIDARPSRPVYQARAGLHSAFAKLSLRYPINHDWQLFASTRFRRLDGGIVRDSPLVRQKSYTSMAAGAIWMFSRSKENAIGEE
ncbi:MAG: MipA/OmpV family protein [Mariprofundaceae bacterium]|nr:MipA/OmpV family protein [Mariprofundaceae bacterium]